jgi:hypothetical protein
LGVVSGEYLAVCGGQNAIIKNINEELKQHSIIYYIVTFVVVDTR